MKIVKHWVLGILAIICGYASFAQDNNQLVTTILPVGGIVNEGHFFRVDVSFTYNTSKYNNYSLKMELPAGVVWDPVAFTTDINSVEIDAGEIESLGNGVYVIPFTPKVAGIKSTNFLIDNLKNNIVSRCTQDSVTDIDFTLQAKQNNVLVPIQTHTSYLTTPKGTNTPGSLELELSHGQELNQNNTNTGNFPYYVDVRISGNRITTLPEITLTYPDTKLTFINAVLYNKVLDQPPFHRQILDNNSIIHSAGSFEIIPLESPRTFHSPVNASGDYIRFYFRTLGNTAILQNEIMLMATGAEYTNCDQVPVPLDTVKKYIPADFPVVPSVSTLLPGIEHKNLGLSFCAQNCDFNISSFQSRFYFEINNIYTQIGGSLPRVKVECPAASKIVNLQFTPGQGGSNPAFKYRVAGSQTELDATVDYNTGIVSFGTDNPQYIFITNYFQAPDANKDRDFIIHYSSKVTDLTSVAIDSKVFRVNYENFTNTKVYTSEPMILSENCQYGLKIRDDYEDYFRVFKDGVFYYPDFPRNHTNIRVTISPLNTLYSSTYKVTGFKYKLNPNMTLDPTNLEILFSESDDPETFRILEPNTNTNGEFYKNINAYLDRANSTLVINNLDLDNTVACGTSKPLYLILAVRVDENTSYASAGYVSSIPVSNTLFRQTHFSTWNVEKSIIDVLSGEVNVLCPTTRQETRDFEKGQTVLVQYEIENETQNPVKDFEFIIPRIPNAVTSIEGVRIRSKNTTSGDLTGLFDVTGFEDGLMINSKNLHTSGSYIMSGNDKMYIEVLFVLDQNLGTGIKMEDITFELERYRSIEGIPRAEVKPLNTKEIRITAKSSCIGLPPCPECVSSFSPLPGQEYLLSAWVKESYNDTTSRPKTYINTGIQITFNDGDIADLPLFQPAPRSPMIDGWQRIEATFTVPYNAVNIHIEMVNNGKNDAFFDDIRIHPFRSNMKSFVYDPSTQRLTAELDENNYATFYEYDDEGILIRIKKETQRGIMTIKESRNNQSKIAETGP